MCHFGGREVYHVELEQEKQEKEDAKVVVEEKVELKHHAKEDEQEGRYEHQHYLPKQPRNPVRRIDEPHS